MRRWVIWGVFLLSSFFFLQFESREVSYAEPWTPEQEQQVNLAVDRYLEKNALRLESSSAIDLSEVSAWRRAEQAELAGQIDDSSATAFGLIKVKAIGKYTRGFPAQLRFFHLLNIDTQEWTRIDVRSAEKGFVLSLAPGEYEVIRVQINEGPFTMESHVNWKFQVRSNEMTYLGTWQFEVESPRTQRKVRVEIISEPVTRDLILEANQLLREKPLLASLPQPLKIESRLFGVAPAQSRAKYFRRR